jgi:hypothetical protein
VAEHALWAIDQIRARLHPEPTILEGANRGLNPNDLVVASTWR